MSIRTDLLTAARDVFVAVVPAAAGKVVRAGAKGPRPAMPYVTLRITTVGGDTHGPAERLDGLNGSVPTATMRERREAVLSMQGFGLGAYDWLDALQIGLDSPGSLAAQKAAGITALLQSGVQDLSRLLDTAEETRSSLELRIRYQYSSTAADQVALERTEVTVELTRYDGDGDTLDADFALDANGDLTAYP